MTTPVAPGTPTNINGAIAARTATTTAPGAYFGQGQTTSLNAMFGQKTGSMSTYGPYDASAVVPYMGVFGSGINGQPVYVNVTDAANQYYKWSPQEQNQFRAKMSLVSSSYLGAADADLANAWAGLVNQSAAYHAAGTNITPWDILSKDVSNLSGSASKARTVNRTVNQVNLTNKVDAQAIFFQAAQQLLGRAPNDSEVSNFQSFLNAKEKANPIVSNIQTTYDASGQVIGTDTTKSSGGVSSDAANFAAMQQAEKSPEYGAYQAATTYMNALKSAIGG